MKYESLLTGEENSPTAAHAGHERRPKLAPCAWWYSWATMPWGIHMVD